VIGKLSVVCVLSGGAVSTSLAIVRV